jgi:hypothetical protein
MSLHEREYHDPARNARRLANPFPPDVPISRLELLLADYRRRLLHPQPGDPPEWYCRAVIDQLEARLNDRPQAS